MKNTNDSTVIASIIVGISIILSTLFYSLFGSNIKTSSEVEHRYSLIKSDKGRFSAYRIDHKTGKVMGISHTLYYPIKERD